MKKFVLTYAYMTKDEIGYVRGSYRSLAVANDLNTLMKSVENYAQRILQVKNPNFFNFNGGWDMRINGSHAEITITVDTENNKDGVHFIIDEVDYLA